MVTFQSFVQETSLSASLISDLFHWDLTTRSVYTFLISSSILSPEYAKSVILKCLSIVTTDLKHFVANGLHHQGHRGKRRNVIRDKIRGSHGGGYGLWHRVVLEVVQEVHTAVDMGCGTVWSWRWYHRSGGTYRFHLQGTCMLW
jgi:hypothetical protein